MDEDGDRAGDSMPERAEGSTWWLWLVLEADRRLVTAGFSAALWLGIVLLGVAQPTPARTLLEAGDPIETLFQALVAATVTAVTLVLTLSQLVLSQELGAVGDQRDRMEGAMTFRSDVADAVDTAVSPAEPSALLRTLVRTTGERARAVDAAAAVDDDHLAALLSNYLGAVTRDADAVAARLEDSTFGTFSVIRAALDYNYSWKLYAGRRLLAEHGDDFTEEARDGISALVETLELFGPAREHFKTLYFQWELSELSRLLLLTAIPALVVSIGTLAFFEPARAPGTVLGLDASLMVLATAVTLSLVPFSVLLAYVLRIVTVTKRTLSIGPFILRETDRDASVDWD